jgi:hypothetical protein
MPCQPRLTDKTATTLEWGFTCVAALFFTALPPSLQDAFDGQSSAVCEIPIRFARCKCLETARLLTSRYIALIAIVTQA